MNYSEIIKFDTGNSHGISTTLFVSGCANHCEECHNPQTWDFNYGKEFTFKVMEEILESLDKPYVKNFVLSGGDPLYYKNLDTVNLICSEIRKKFGSKKEIILYTGMTVDEILVSNELNRKRKEIITKINYLIDGRYEKDKKIKGIDLRGSYNQQCYHVIPYNDGYKLINVSFEYFNGEKYIIPDLENYAIFFKI